MTLKQKNERAIKRCKNQIAILFQKYGEELPSMFFRWMHVVCHHPTFAFCHYEAKEKREWIDCFFHDVID